MEETKIQTAIDYHQLSKHHFHQYAPGPGYLNWESQPNPFRTYHGAPQIPLERIPLANIHGQAIPLPSKPFPISKESVSQLFYDSMALSAWKEINGHKWALRKNPSSGNLHPTEAYWLGPALTDICLTPFVAHYSPLSHALEIRSRFTLESWNQLISQQQLPASTTFVALTSIFWREAWKYGLRAYRYCQHDVGHAIGALSYAAAELGWEVRLLDQWTDIDLQALLGLTEQKQHLAHAEHPDCLLALIPQSSPENLAFSQKVNQTRLCPSEFSLLEWQGEPNRLGPVENDWPEIEAVANACIREPISLTFDDLINRREKKPLVSTVAQSYRPFIHQRRSAVAFDGQTSLSQAAFFHILGQTLQHPLILKALPWESQIHLLLFVHRVEQVPPGLYCLIRNDKHQPELQQQMHQHFTWTKPLACPTELPLYHLEGGDARMMAKQVSCGQDIAADSGFSLGMLARFALPLQERGASFYPRLYWECGAIGQILYIESEAKGLRGTGIGCFFDDPVLKCFGIEGDDYQSLYHFTVGFPVEDLRLTTLDAYHHLNNQNDQKI